MSLYLALIASSNDSVISSLVGSYWCTNSSSAIKSKGLSLVLGMTKYIKDIGFTLSVSELKMLPPYGGNLELAFLPPASRLRGTLVLPTSVRFNGYVSIGVDSHNLLLSCVLSQTTRSSHATSHRAGHTSQRHWLVRIGCSHFWVGI